MDTDELFYMCINRKCSNYYLNKNSFGISIPYKYYEIEDRPKCNVCDVSMDSELERKLELLKAELNIPQQTGLDLEQ